jgi:hypothetical protein
MRTISRRSPGHDIGAGGAGGGGGGMTHAGAVAGASCAVEADKALEGEVGIA